MIFFTREIQMCKREPISRRLYDVTSREELTTNCWWYLVDWVEQRRRCQISLIPTYSSESSAAVDPSKERSFETNKPFSLYDHRWD